MCVLSLERDGQGLGEGLTTDGLILRVYGKTTRQGPGTPGGGAGTEEPWEDLEQGRGRVRSEHGRDPLCGRVVGGLAFEPGPGGWWRGSRRAEQKYEQKAGAWDSCRIEEGWRCGEPG